MASSGKKGKKTKGKTLALTDFLQETPGSTPIIPLRKTTNWADEVEDAYDSYDSRAKTNIVLPTAPKAARGLDDYSDKIPQNPPYMAYLSNLPYDVDEEEIADFFKNLKIANMRIPKDERTGDLPRLKGYGYVEFEDRDSLLGALAIPDCTLKNRRIRIEVATNSENDRRRGRMDMGRDRPERPEVSMGDWRSGPRSDLPESDRRGGGGSNYNRDSGFGRERDNNPERDRPGAWRDSSDRPTFRDNDRDRGFSRDSERGFNDRGRFSDRDGERDRRGFGDRGSFGSRRNDRDDRDGGFSRGGPRDDQPASAEPKTRRKLVLAPRTKPLENPPPAEQEPTAPEKPVPTPVPAASIFGSAKPVDTSARERQIEERLLAKQNEKPEQEPSRDSRWDDDRPRRRFNDRRSPRRESPERRSPPRRSPVRNGSPANYRKDSPERGRRSPYRRTDSPDYRRSSDDRRDSRHNSTERMRRSPDYRKDSAERRGYSSERRRDSPDRKQTPDRESPVFRTSPSHGRSPERRRYSPDHKRSPSPQRAASPERRRDSPSKRRSPEMRRNSGDRRKKSMDKPRDRRRSPGDNRKASPDRKQLPPRKDERKGPKADKQKEKPEKPRQREEREMPKLKEPEPPNFASSNKFSFLQAEGDSD